MDKINLPNVTLVCIDCVNYRAAINAVWESAEKINFGRVLLLTDRYYELEGIEVVIIDKLRSKEAYSEFMLFELNKHIKTEYCLVIQYDGYVINPQAWNNEWLNYDYIGAPWWYNERNIGNGGFSLRSKKLLDTIPYFVMENSKTHPEDNFICRQIGKELNQAGIKFAPEFIAKDFSFEPNGKYDIKDFNYQTFGFHGIHNLILK